jgi:hypothetical protein
LPPAGNRLIEGVAIFNIVFGDIGWTSYQPTQCATSTTH